MSRTTLTDRPRVSSGRLRFRANGTELGDGQLHRLVLVEVVARPQFVENIEANETADRLLYDVVIETPPRSATACTSAMSLSSS